MTHIKNAPINCISNPTYASLTNFYLSPFTYQGIRYNTAEHAFAAARTSDKDLKAQIARAGTPNEAKRLSEAGLKNPRFEAQKASMMYRIVREKFKQNKELAARLLSTGNRPVLYNTTSDEYWGTGKYGTGQNLMGKILQKVRSDLRK